MEFGIGLVVGVVIGMLVGPVVMKQKPAERSPLESKASNGAGEAAYVREDDRAKADNLAKVEAYIAGKDTFTNDDIQQLLGVSNATVGRYLEDLEQAGKIEQHGEVGQGVYYSKK